MAGSRIDACGKRQHAGQQHGQQRQRNSQHHALRNQLGNGAAIGVADAQLALQQPADPLPITHGRGLVKAELALQRLHGVGRGIRSEHDLRGIARQDFEHGKHHHGRKQQGDEHGSKAFEQKQSHVGRQG